MRAELEGKKEHVTSLITAAKEQGKKTTKLEENQASPSLPPSLDARVPKRLSSLVPRISSLFPPQPLSLPLLPPPRCSGIGTRCPYPQGRPRRRRV